MRPCVHLWFLAVTVLGLAALRCTAEEITFDCHVINPSTDYSAAAVLDVNRDGKLDIVCGGDWYEAPDWERHYVRSVPRIRDRPDGFAHLALDINRDGWTDIVTVNYRSRSIKWVQHPGADFGPWTTHVVVEPGPMETGRLIDVDGDGQVDLLPNGARFAAWFELIWDDDSSAAAPRWQRHDLPAQLGGHGLGFGDIDGDGRGDIVGQFGWLKAPEDRRTGRWHWHPEFHLERASIPMIVADVDEDGDSDVVWASAHGFGVYWLEQTKQGGYRQWVRHAIDTSWSQGHAPLWVDLDGDGRRELVAGKRYMSHGGSDPGAYDPISVYRYQFDPTTRAWQRWTISAGQRVSLGLDPKAADIDGDGDLDLIASGRSGLYLLENRGPGATPRQPSSVDDSRQSELLVVRDAEGVVRPIRNAADWGRRRAQIAAAVQAAWGPVPEPAQRAPLDMQVEREVVEEMLVRRRISYQTDLHRRDSAELLLRKDAPIGTNVGILCMWNDPLQADSEQVTRRLAERGYVCLLPDRSSRESPGRIMATVWRAMRAVDVLQSLPEVHGERIGYVSDGRVGSMGLLLPALDQRIIASVVGNPEAVRDTASSGCSTAELVAAIAPRAVLIGEPQDEAAGVRMREWVERAAAVYELRGVPERLRLIAHQESLHARVSQWLDTQFRRKE